MKHSRAILTPTCAVMKEMPRLMRVLPVAGLLVLLTACLPAVQEDGRPDVAVINAPTENRVDGMARELESLLEARYEPLTYDFVTGRRVRFQETHRDMHGSRAPLQAAFISRALGSELSVMIGAPIYEREIITSDGLFGQSRKVIITVQLEAFIVEPDNAEVRGHVISGVHHRVRLEPPDVPLPEPEDDPDLQAAVEDALEDVAGALDARLKELLGTGPRSLEPGGSLLRSGT